MIVYSVKYALTTGIVRYEASECTGWQGMVEVKFPFGNLFLKVGRDAFLTFEEAQAAAQKMALKKVQSLEKQLVKLRKMKFDAFKDAG